MEEEEFIVPTYEELSPTVLYDIFYENGTIYGGRLISVENMARAMGDEELVKQCFEERLQLAKERAAVAGDDRDTQIACIRKWQARREELGRMYPDRNKWRETKKQ